MNENKNKNLILIKSLIKNSTYKFKVELKK
jgi:hypothetical protein